MANFAMPARPDAPPPDRRLVAAGTIRHLAGRTITVRATQAGVTGTSRPAPAASEPDAGPDKVFAEWTEQQLTAWRDTLHTQIIQLTGAEMWQAIHWRDRVTAELNIRARAADRRTQALMEARQAMAFASCPHHAGSGAEATA
ncbi:hypothetical protein H8N00_03780 [Streptomyces sp. AC563]|uniref:hypothetical protein n=1 Tax=Streptomyces buecherae TaxID=2763006 RepID=UPI00164CE30F|nr:hypothetical protein [Streptomyces buecherae]MBC3988033.1 hypothetical protein [Streptomyces buecherae]